MGWLTNIFKTKELLYLEQLYKEVKEDKEQLKTDNKKLQDEINALNKQILELTNKQHYNTNNTYNNPQTTNETIFDIQTEPQKLAPKEKFILNLVEEHKNFSDVLKHSGLKEQSLKVYLSRIKRKGHSFTLE
jgi:DNA-binding CsgD family transcriptional regulator